VSAPDDFYSLLQRAPDPARVVGWEHALGQAARFEAAIAPVTLGDTVLDVGCGIGDLYGYLMRSRSRVTYMGIDQLAPMVERARRRHPGGFFLQKNALDGSDLPNADVVVAIGALVDGRPLKDEDARLAKLMLLMSRALRAARRCAVIVALDQDVVDGRLMFRAEEALAGLREADVALVARKLGVDYEVHRVLTTDLAATLWRPEPEVRRIPVAGDYAARALAGPMGKDVAPVDEAWLWYAAGERDKATAALAKAEESMRTRWLRDAIAGMAPRP